MLVQGDNGPNTLYSIPLGGGGTTSVGLLGTQLFGMDFAGSRLFGVDADGRLYTVNTSTGSATEIGDTGSQTYLSLAMINPLLGDVNRDGMVNLLDVAPFVNLITTGTFQTQADMNQDGEVNLLDVNPFIQALTGP
jgi:hypothetical protein